MLNSLDSAVFFTSTTGDSPVTVIVSATVATSRVTFTVTVRPPATMMPSRFRVWKPTSSKRRLYVPGPKARNRYVPSSTVVASCSPMTA